MISLRVKDAVVKQGAKLVLVSPRWGELVDFAAVWLQPQPGTEAATVQALAEAGAADPAGVDGERLEAARALLAESLPRAAPAADDDEDSGAEGPPACAIVFAPGALSAEVAGAQAAACANLAIAALGARAAQGLHYLPTDANVLGISDMGVAPGEGGRSFPEIIEGARDGEIRALLIHDDNPLLNAPGSDDVRAALSTVEALVVIDSLRSTTALHANVVLAELPFFAKDGTITTGDRRITRQRPAAQPRRDERDGVAILTALANALGADFAYESAGEVMAEAAARLEGYEPHEAIRSASTRALSASPASGASPQPLPASTDDATDGLRLIADRSLYTSWEGASLRSEEADKLHREESLLINPAGRRTARRAQRRRAGAGERLARGAHRRATRRRRPARRRLRLALLRRRAR